MEDYSCIFFHVILFTFNFRSLSRIFWGLHTFFATAATGSLRKPFDKGKNRAQECKTRTFRRSPVRRSLLLPAVMLALGVCPEGWAQQASSSPPPASSAPTVPPSNDVNAPALPTPAGPTASLLRPREASPPALEYLKSQGVRLVSLGDVGGLQGYLAEAPDGKNQVFYLSPDGRILVAGIAFDDKGTNMTGLQIGEMRRRLDAERARVDEERRRAEQAAAEANARVRATDQRAQELTNAGLLFGGPLITNRERPAREPGSNAPPAVEAPDTPNAAAPAPSEAPRGAQQGANTSAGTPAPAASGGTEQFVSPMNQSEVMAALEGLPWFRIGRDSDPTVYMLADPQCRFCHAAWRELRPRIVAGEISVRVILVGALPGSQERVISILARGNEAGRAWLRGEGSDGNTRIEPPPAAETPQFKEAERFANANLAFAQRFNLTQTPWLAYRGGDGRLYAKYGSNDLPEFLKALPPRAPRN